MPIYLDHSATTKPLPAAIDCYIRDMSSAFANPASAHRLGQAAEKSLLAAKEAIAANLGCRRDQLILTSGGSESINHALKGTLWASPPGSRRLIISQGEHPAVRESAAWLERQGCEVVRLPLTAGGTADLDSLADALRRPAALISLIHVSNETGAVNPAAEIAGLRDRLQPRTPIHLDAVQSPGKLAFPFQQSGVDLLSGSGHKVGAPRGIGWLICQKSGRLQPLIHGGGQQGGQRAGTENPPLAAALALALAEATDRLPEKTARVQALRQLLLAELTAAGLDFLVLSPPDAVPHILTLAFPGLRGETLLHALEAREIYLSTGSACSSRRSQGNPVLKAMGVADADAVCAVRISLAADNQEQEMRDTAGAIAENCRRLRRRLPAAH